MAWHAAQFTKSKELNQKKNCTCAAMGPKKGKSKDKEKNANDLKASSLGILWSY